MIPDKKLKLEKGMYQEAIKVGLPFNVWLEKHLVEQYQMEPTIYEEQQMTNFQKFFFRRELKKQGKEIPADGFEIALKMAGIRAFGVNTDRVSKFFVSSDTTILFPEYISNRVYAAAMRSALWPELVAETTTITGLDFRKMMLDDTEAQRQTSRRSRGAEFPRKKFTVGKELTRLAKYGIVLEIDYEAIAESPINFFGLVVERVGAQIGIDETDDCIYNMVNGDGNSNGLTSANTVETGTTATIVKRDIINFSGELDAPYQLDKFVGPKDYMHAYKDALSDMTNPSAQWGVTGMTLPQGYEWDRGAVDTAGDRFYGVDSRFAMGAVTNDSMALTETDKIISRQTTETVISKRIVFPVLDTNAIGCLDIEH